MVGPEVGRMQLRAMGTALNDRLGNTREVLISSRV